MIRVMVVDDQLLIRAGIKTLLELPSDHESIEVVSEAKNGAHAVESLAATGDVDVVLMDIKMPVLDGLSALLHIKADNSGVPVVMLTTFDNDELLFDSLAAGAAGFVRKDLDPADLQDAVRRAHHGVPALDPVTMRRVIGEAVENRRHERTAVAAHVSDLTPRERELIVRVGRGLSNEEIAAELVLSTATVRTYVSRLMTKLGCRDRVALAILSYTENLGMRDRVD